jgi:phosphate starvation-inducible protein PhoH
MLRGHTFNDAWVIFDEAQNATAKQMKLFLTRFGKNCKMIVDADPYDQCDIGDGAMSGFIDAWELMLGHPKNRLHRVHPRRHRALRHVPRHPPPLQHQEGHTEPWLPPTP